FRMADARRLADVVKVVGKLEDKKELRLRRGRLAGASR
ncbi:MAG: hypothetical protein JWO70_426, partial [Betaproteobacteria bacterium]|nr:hypothetical protein [Betaproteobacteria bacterium]